MPYQRDALAARGMIVETFETACTWDRFPALRAAVATAAADAMRQVGAEGVLTCRFTHVYPDGPAPYFGIYAAGRWGQTVEQWDEIKLAVSEAILSSEAASRTTTPSVATTAPGTTVSGRTCSPRPCAPAKSVLDPAGILNPGVLIDPL